ncbi:unnamed protein product [Rotaria sp. Silwood2]|nr:unnamed protein product [Rotaria sp. Silwood2]
MPRVPIASEDERKFIVDGIQSNFRNDGRNCRTYRPLLLATDVINTANGSCLLKLVLRYEGNLHDACSFAMKAALSETKVPALKVTHDEETNEVSVDVCDDPYEYGVLDVSNLPVLITVGQINGVHTVDTTIKEDSVTLARITYGIKSSGSIVYMNKDGGGSLDLLNIRSMAKIASDIGPQMNELLVKKIQLSKEKQASWGHTNERLLFNDDNFV